jgi:hypothetical protein
MDCILASMRISIYKQLPEDEKKTLRELRKETTRRFNEGFMSEDNNGKNILTLKIFGRTCRWRLIITPCRSFLRFFDLFQFLSLRALIQLL